MAPQARDCLPPFGGDGHDDRTASISNRFIAMRILATPFSPLRSKRQLVSVVSRLEAAKLGERGGELETS